MLLFGALLFGPLLFGIDMRVKLFAARKIAGFSELEGRCDSRFDLRVDAGALGRIELIADDTNLVAFLPRAQFVAIAITRVVVLARSNVFAPAIDVAFEKCRAGFASAHRCNRFRGQPADFENIAAGDLMRGHSVSADALAKLA